jgi:hypothetical protein
MCQAYEAERNYIVAMESHVAQKGWAAHRDGKPREYDYFVYEDAFFHGWDCRAYYKKLGDPIPFGIVESFRKQREWETGQVCRAEPTREDADLIA